MATYFDIIPKDVLTCIMSKLTLDSLVFKSMYPEISINEILIHLPKEILSEFDKVKMKYSKIFNTFDLMGLILAYNADEDEMGMLEKDYSYLKIWSLWRIIISANGILQSINSNVSDDINEDHCRYVIKGKYNDVYIRMNVSKFEFRHKWWDLLKEFYKFDAKYGFHKYTRRAITKGANPDDSLSLISVKMSTSEDEFPALYDILKDIIK
jgi:hypothetical protein